MKISLTLDLAKIDKNRVNNRTYTNKEGVEVIVKEYKLDVVPLKEKKVLKSGDSWRLVKTHFVADTPTKEERENKTKTNFIGDGVQFENLNEPVSNPDTDVPF